jgi:hypothetical protein
VELELEASPPSTEALPDRIIVHSNAGFLVDRPRRDGDVPGLLTMLRQNGVRTLAWSFAQSLEPDFSFEGLLPLARIAKLEPKVTRSVEFSNDPTTATLVHSSLSHGDPSPCVTLSDGTVVWVVRSDSSAGKLGLYCPTRQPSYYDVGRVH